MGSGNNLDRFGNPIPAVPGYQVIVNADGSVCQQRNTLILPASLVATDSPLNQSTLLSPASNFMPLTYQTLDIDGLAAVGFTFKVVPAVSVAYGLWGVTFGLIIMSHGGTMTTAPIIKLGTNAAHDNLSTSSAISTTAVINAATNGTRGTIAIALVNGLTAVPTMDNDLTAEVITQGAGGTLTYRLFAIYGLIKF